MKDQNANQLLTKVMGWQDSDVIDNMVKVSNLQLLSDLKYDHYQRFGPGKRFIESLALWLRQFDQSDRVTALDFVLQRLVFFSEYELSHLVQTAFPDLIVQERIRLIAEEQDIPQHRVGQISAHPRFIELGLKSLYLGLSDGARTSELRRASSNGISNDQIWQAYELGEDKSNDMICALRTSLDLHGFISAPAQFTLVWLLDDFSGSGYTYIRYDENKETGKTDFKGKIKKAYDQLHAVGLVDPSHYEVFLLLYVATKQAIDHIEYWAERFTSARKYKPLQLKVLCPIEPCVAMRDSTSTEINAILDNPKYYDEIVVDKHFLVGGAKSPQRGFAGCSLPVVLSHNIPNNSLYILWGPEHTRFTGLFPRVSRHREF